MMDLNYTIQLVLIHFHLYYLEERFTESEGWFFNKVKDAVVTNPNYLSKFEQEIIPQFFQELFFSFSKNKDEEAEMNITYALVFIYQIFGQEIMVNSLTNTMISSALKRFAKTKDYNGLLAEYSNDIDIA